MEHSSFQLLDRIRDLTLDNAILTRSFKEFKVVVIVVIILLFLSTLFYYSLKRDFGDVKTDIKEIKKEAASTRREIAEIKKYISNKNLNRL